MKAMLINQKWTMQMHLLYIPQQHVRETRVKLQICQITVVTLLPHLAEVFVTMM